MEHRATFLQQYEDFDAVLHSIYCAIWVIDSSGRVVYSNDAAAVLRRRLPAGDEALLKALGKQVDISCGQGRFVVAMEKRSAICNLKPWERAGRRIGSIIVAHESGQGQCAAQELDVVLDMVEEIDAILEVAAAGILVADKNGAVVRVNRRLEKIFGLRRQDVLGQEAAQTIKKDPLFLQLISDMIQMPKKRVLAGDYEGRELVYSGVPIFDKQRRLKAVVVSIQDISAIHQLQKKLEEQRLYTDGYMREVAFFNGSSGPVVAYSKAMKKILHLVRVVADVESVVLLTGESGTGKEVIVNEIYRMSRRNDKPFIKINCGAIPETLFESELFGYESGAFTGARRQGKIGFFELAHTGTLLLDEIGDLTLASQVKLLRVIQEGEVQRIGAPRPVTVDVRVIAATNKDLWAMVREGTFRQDLYYRLNVIHIHIPPLRERREDIVPLANYFLQRFNKKYGKQKEISPELYRFLLRQDWPGNIRELENAVETMVVLPSEDRLTPAHFVGKGRGEDDGAAVSVRFVVPWKQAVEEMEKGLLIQAAGQYKSTRAMAKALGIDQSTVVRKMKKWGLTDTYGENADA